jgi:hypothetical protein
MIGFLEQIASDEVLDEAYAWLCDRREHYSHHDDVWDVRFHWPEIKPVLQATLLGGEYRFSPLRRIHRAEDDLEIWSALDSLVLKAIAIVLTQQLAPKLSDRCCHLAGNGGAKAAVRYVLEKLPANQFVFRTDVKSYYASIDHDVLYSQLAGRIDDPRLLDLLRQYLRRTVYDDGLYEDVTQGISAVAAHGSRVPGHAGPADGNDRTRLRAVHGRLEGAGPDTLEAAGGDPRRQPGPGGIRSPTASRQDVRGLDRGGIRVLGIPLQLRWLSRRRQGNV